jgi:hypothetical protein
MLGNYGVSKQLGISRVVFSSMELVSSHGVACQRHTFKTNVTEPVMLQDNRYRQQAVAACEKTA